MQENILLDCLKLKIVLFYEYYMSIFCKYWNYFLCIKIALFNLLFIYLCLQTNNKVANNRNSICRSIEIYKTHNTERDNRRARLNILVPACWCQQINLKNYFRSTHIFLYLYDQVVGNFCFRHYYWWIHGSIFGNMTHFLLS